MSQQKHLWDYAKRGKREYKNALLDHELQSYMKKGISLSIKGISATPDEISFAYAVCENETPYMRDFITDDNGIVQMIDFTRID